ncbi:hypothetical protein GCM10011369_08630 [Neiella marina]|uniref:Solute-binding protein family 3/N-terminal domain-containing protein n=1 Tax=Neiella marina TaxID=508461 RepID=A0A8J2U3A3_9GAMM|nr:transporter substrate-binding domain-containing protein [Neiella marina]GGA69256.1 hypothetical protein GCM10011369_08630 [Neiella marina]
MSRKAMLVAFAYFVATDSQAQNCEVVTATAHPNYPPYQWRQEDKIVGATIDITRELFSQLNVDFQANYTGPWKRALQQVKVGQVDMVIGLKKTTDREQYISFTSSPIATNPFTVFVLQGNQFDIKTWRDLYGKKGGKNAGDRYGNAFDTFADRYLDLEESYAVASNFNKLKAGRIDYFIHSRFAGLAQLSVSADAASFAVLPYNVNEGLLHSGFATNSPCAIYNGAISLGYQKLLDSGEVERLLKLNIAKWQQQTNHSK